MGFLGIGKRNEVIDLSERYPRQKERTNQMKEDSKNQPATSNQEISSGGMFNFFGNMSSASSSIEKEQDESMDPEEKKRKLAKRLMDMTDKIEELSNQIYHLQQRVEVLERKKQIGEDYLE